MELFDLLLRIGRLQCHFGLAWCRAEREESQEPAQEPSGPMLHLQPLEGPMPVVIDDDDDTELRQRLGCGRVGFP